MRAELAAVLYQARLPTSDLADSNTDIDGRLGCLLADWTLSLCSSANGLVEHGGYSGSDKRGALLSAR